MCLSANEPGGPRRCGNYRRRIERQLDQLTIATHEHQKISASNQKERERWQQTYGEAFEKAKQENLPESERPPKEFIEEGLKEQERLLQLAAKEGQASANVSIARANLTALMTVHQEETERFGEIVENSIDPKFSEDEPYLILSPLNHKRVTDILASGQYGQGVEVRTRKRLIPLMQPDGSAHPYLSVGVIDVQFDNPALIEAFEGAEEGSDYGYENPEKWHISAESLLTATLRNTRNGRDYISKKDTPEGQESTADKIKKLVFSNHPAVIVADKKDVDSFMWFAKKYPGTSSYSAKVREIANKGYVSATDAPILISAVSGWRRYVDQKEQQAEQAAQRARSQHLGTVGAPLNTGTLTVQKVHVGESQFGGFYTSVTAVDERGNVIRWSDSKAPEFSEGDMVSFTAEVREHTEYRGTKQTSLKAPDSYIRLVNRPGAPGGLPQSSSAQPGARPLRLAHQVESRQVA